MFAVYLGHTEGWTPRSDTSMEAVLKRVADSTSLCIAACDGNLEHDEVRFADGAQDFGCTSAYLLRQVKWAFLIAWKVIYRACAAGGALVEKTVRLSGQTQVGEERERRDR